jgi:hypothetical protein
MWQDPSALAKSQTHNLENSITINKQRVNIPEVALLDHLP